MTTRADGTSDFAPSDPAPTVIAVDLAEADAAHVWHPFTQQAGWVAEGAPIIERAHGTTLHDTDGNAYIDGVSSLWCNVHGHGHPQIDQAIRDQLDRVAHSTMLGLSHPGAIELARRLVEIAPPGLSRVFYSDSGSTAVEIAVKMAFQWWAQRGEPQRTRFVTLREAYHGDTIGSVSVGGIDLFHSVYRPLLFDAVQVPAGDAGALGAALAAHGDTVAAVIVEPLVQGAAGMLLQPDGYLAEVRRLCDEHGALLICDEVATGFGRTGRMFACEHENVSPDLMCVAKGLTGGYLPLAATLATEEIYDGFLGAHEEYRTFFHGHTYTGNPLACAAALATLDVFEQEQTLAQLQPKIALLADELAAQVAPLPAVAEIRRRGFMVGIELGRPRPQRHRDGDGRSRELTGFAPADRIGHAVTLAARARGAIVRPLSDVVVLMPPLAISAQELRRLVAITAASIAEATGSGAAAGTGAGAAAAPA